MIPFWDRQWWGRRSLNYYQTSLYVFQGTDKFALVCVGHSLGGGTAAILAIILRCWKPSDILFLMILSETIRASIFDDFPFDPSSCNSNNNFWSTHKVNFGVRSPPAKKIYLSVKVVSAGNNIQALHVFPIPLRAAFWGNPILFLHQTSRRIFSPSRLLADMVWHKL